MKQLSSRSQLHARTHPRCDCLWHEKDTRMIKLKFLPIDAKKRKYLVNLMLEILKYITFTILHENNIFDDSKQQQPHLVIAGSIFTSSLGLICCQCNVLLNCQRIIYYNVPLSDDIWINL
jgi:hypothetical protein